VFERALQLQIYIVTRVCPELTPASQFPSENYTTYENYYDQKYKLSIVNKQQALLEVKAVSNKINCLRPRYCSIQLQAVLSMVP
jgi:endoribonuclease Dicer